MKKFLLPILLCLSMISFIAPTSQAQSKLIHYWHFNTATPPAPMYTTTPPGILGIKANYSLIDTNKAQILYRTQAGTSSAYSTYLDFYTPASSEYDTVNVRMNDTTNNLAFKARNPSDSMELRFYIPTTHYKNIVVKFGCERTTNGATLQTYDYSLDSGATWKTSGLAVAADSGTYNQFSLVSESFTDTLVYNNPRLIFRIKSFTGGLVNSTSGNDRFDNVTVEGDTDLVRTAVPVVVANTTPTFTIFPNPVTNTLNISTETEGLKMISIRNVAGEQVFAGSLMGKQYPMDISSLQAGVYFITINDGNNGKTGTAQFIKQ